MTAGHILAIDLAIGCFNALAGALCISAAVGNYIVYGPSLRVMALMVFFALSGLMFIVLELCTRFTPLVQRQASHLNTYQGRAVHYFLIAILASDTVVIRMYSFGLYLWLWGNSIALFSISITFLALAIAAACSDRVPLPRSMDVERTTAHRKQAYRNHDNGDDMAEATERFSTSSVTDSPHGRFADRPMTTMHDDALGLSTFPSFSSEKDGFATPPLHGFQTGQGHGPAYWVTGSPALQQSGWTHVGDQPYAYKHGSSSLIDLSRKNRHRPTESFGSFTAAAAKAEVNHKRRQSDQSDASGAGESPRNLAGHMSRSSMESKSSGPRTPRGVVRLLGPRRQSAVPSPTDALRYETKNQRLASREGAASSPSLAQWTPPPMGNGERRKSAFHRKLSYDAIGAQSDAEDSDGRHKAASKVKVSRVFVPSLGAAIDLSSGSESSEDEVEVRLDRDDEGSIYSLPSGVSPADDFRHELGTDSAAKLGRRLSRGETRSFRRKINRGIQRAMSQRTAQQGQPDARLNDTF